MRIFVHELRGELQLYSRSRELAFFTFMLPMIFFVLLGSVYGSGDTIDGYRGADYLLSGNDRLRPRRHGLRRAGDRARHPARERRPETAPGDSASGRPSTSRAFCSRR